MNVRMYYLARWLLIRRRIEDQMWAARVPVIRRQLHDMGMRRG